jgi:UDP-N-acetylglucosamine diphosphorylase / glucose-1-phosphate thymidylyltransferase / UDP-N-acetylgalactosamine diphosphorylase / glucosamine-1-phosphate N-acetyltransferase / galactosamine-1-phosphate N-acetyltransferase
MPLSTGGFFVHAGRPVKASDFFALPDSLAAFRAFFPAGAPPWEWLRQIGPALEALLPREGTPRVPAGVHLEGRVHIGPGVSLPSHATIIGPVWIGAATEIRPGAFIRGNVIAGAGCILGNSSEFKNCLLLDGVQAAHFIYVGDSVLGNRAHLGAGAICSNLRLDHRDVAVHLPAGAIDTGLRKFGAIVGEDAQVGCNAVLNPGTLLGKRSLVMPAIAFGGVLAPSTIARARQQVTLVPRKD